MKQHQNVIKETPVALHLVERIGATIAGHKPAEIRTVNEAEYRSVYAKLLKEEKAIRIRTIKQCESKRQVFIYHEDSLNAVLKRKSTQWFLGSMGYPKHYSLDHYVNHLVSRLREKDFPHEIGVFLGYPLKDVLGYMGRTRLPHTKTMGWRMYGDTTQSEKLYARFYKARKQARKHLKMNLQMETFAN